MTRDCSTCDKPYLDAQDSPRCRINGLPCSAANAQDCTDWERAVGADDEIPSRCNWCRPAHAN